MPTLGYIAQLKKGVAGRSNLPAVLSGEAQKSCLAG
jgi:hypothetical protein